MQQMVHSMIEEDMEGGSHQHQHQQDVQTSCEALLSSISEKVNTVKKLSSEACIFKVHQGLRKTNPEAYTPLIISIGPYHHHRGNSNSFKKMEKLKELYLQSFLERARVKGFCLKDCWKKLEDLKDRAERYYGDDIQVGGDDEFVKMLLLDGCFIVEFIFRRSTRTRSGGGQEYRGDPIFMISGMITNVDRDILLLENQLPFFVLQALYEMINDDGGELWEKVKIIFENILPKKPLLTMVNAQNIKHLLQVVHILCQPGLGIQQQPCFPCCCCCCFDIESNGQPQQYRNRNRNCMCFLCRFRNCTCFLCRFGKQSTDDGSDDSDYCSVGTATELHEAGVYFKKVETASLFDIKFNHKVLEIPSFVLFDGTETFFRNLIAYEQHSYDVSPKYFTDYAIFMDYLINTDKDVNLLRIKDVFINGLGDDKEVTDLFNKLCKGVEYPSKFYYAALCKELNQHCRKPWNVMMAKLRRDYFHTPWAGISTIAAILLLSLTIAQTVLAALGLHK